MIELERTQLLSLSFEFCFHNSFELQVGNNGVTTFCMAMIYGFYSCFLMMDSSTQFNWFLIKYFGVESIDS